jgi:hypothetical protein
MTASFSICLFPIHSHCFGIFKADHSFLFEFNVLPGFGCLRQIIYLFEFNVIPRSSLVLVAATTTLMLLTMRLLFLTTEVCRLCSLSLAILVALASRGVKVLL